MVSVHPAGTVAHGRPRANPATRSLERGLSTFFDVRFPLPSRAGRGRGTRGLAVRSASVRPGRTLLARVVPTETGADGMLKEAEVRARR